MPPDQSLQVSITPASRERVLGVLQKLRLLGAAARV